MAFLDMRDGVLTRSLESITGSKHGTIPYTKRKPLPVDPATSSQLNKRQIFTRLIQLGKKLLPLVLNDWYPKKMKGLSALNFFSKLNKAVMSISIWNLKNVLISLGSLYTPTTFIVNSMLPSPFISIDWSTLKQGEATNNDDILFVIRNSKNKKWYATTGLKRGHGNGVINIDAVAGTVAQAYMSFRNGQWRFSNSVFKATVLPS